MEPGHQNIQESEMHGELRVFPTCLVPGILAALSVYGWELASDGAMSQCPTTGKMVRTPEEYTLLYQLFRRECIRVDY